MATSRDKHRYDMVAGHQVVNIRAHCCHDPGSFMPNYHGQRSRPDAFNYREVRMTDASGSHLDNDLAWPGLPELDFLDLQGF
jgi:hypothetical protein